jgi:hypothetical protein
MLEQEIAPTKGCKTIENFFNIITHGSLISFSVSKIG